MPPSAGVVVPLSDRMPPRVMPMVPVVYSETAAKDAYIAWFRTEFAAANAIIDALCGHLTQLEGGVVGMGSEYESVFTAIHRRRREWIPIINMQKYYSIADVTLELRKVASKKSQEKNISLQNEEVAKAQEENNELASSYSDKETSPELYGSEKEIVPENSEKEIISENGNDGDGEVVDEDTSKGDSPENEITDTGSQEVQQSSLQNTEICSNHEACEARRDQIKIMKGFIAKEPVKGHMVNVVRGLKLYEDVFTDNELSKLNDFVNELRVAGRNGELTGETFSLYNQQIKGSKREQIRFGVPVFEQIKEDSASRSQRSDIEPIPSLLEDIIEHLVQWHLISESRRPNSCIISFFDEDEYSQPYLKPPHLDQPISTLLLSESKMAFGHTLVNDNEGNYVGPLVLPVKQGSLLVMKGNSAEVGRHVLCSSPNKRVSITFIKNRTQTERSVESIPSPTTAMNLCYPDSPNPHSTPAGAVNGYQPMGVIQKWGALRAPVVMLAPLRPVVMSTRRMPRGGTGVFLPWTVRTRKPAKHLPPRAQRGRLLAMSSPAETCKTESTSDPSINIEQRVQ